MRVATVTLAVAVAAACASGHTSSGVIDAPPAGGGSDTGASSGSSACPDGQLATHVDGAGLVDCAQPDGATQAALDDRCSVYLGWRDACDGCTTAPDKWGLVGGGHCTNGNGTDSTCTMATLGANLVPLFGLNFDGDVDGNDKIYASLHCKTAAKMYDFAPCPPGMFVTGKMGSSYTCEALVDVVAAYVATSCSLYLGWQDSCDGCTTIPAKWGYSGDGGCMNGTGTDDTCQTVTLGAETVQLFGISPDGDVDGNDKLHIGLSCAPASGGASEGTSCPDGQFVVGTNTDGTVHCASPAPLIAQYFSDHCAVYYGWRDACDACTDPPLKWGKVRLGDCTNGAGTDDTCSKFTLGGQGIQMFGLSPDGNVDGNDKLYVGFQCR